MYCTHRSDRILWLEPGYKPTMSTSYNGNAACFRGLTLSTLNDVDLLTSAIPSSSTTYGRYRTDWRVNWRKSVPVSHHSSLHETVCHEHADCYLIGTVLGARGVLYLTQHAKSRRKIERPRRKADEIRSRPHALCIAALRQYHVCD